MALIRQGSRVAIMTESRTKKRSLLATALYSVVAASVLCSLISASDVAVREPAGPKTPGYWKKPAQPTSLLQAASESFSKFRPSFNRPEKSQQQQSAKRNRRVRYETWNPLRGIRNRMQKLRKRTAPSSASEPNSPTFDGHLESGNQRNGAGISESNTQLDLSLFQAPSSHRPFRDSSIQLAGFQEPGPLQQPQDENSLPADAGEKNQPVLPGSVVDPNAKTSKAAPNQIAGPQKRIPVAVPVPGKADQFRLPINDLSPEMKLGGDGEFISLQVSRAQLGDVINLIAMQHNLNVISAGGSIDGVVSVSLAKAKLDDALEAILSVNGYTWVKRKNILIVSKVDQQSDASPLVQGRIVKVFKLNYVSAADIDAVVKGLLSKVGQSFTAELTPGDRRKTREQIVIEDLPDYVARIGKYIKQVDQPPRQVLIEAHVLRVDLSDVNRHGVNLETLVELANADITLRTQGFANANSSPAFFLGIDGGDLDSLLEAIKTTTDAKTLASPKVLAVNGQESKIQIGERLGYLVTTTTQTSTLQNVNFLETGIVLTVTPTITDGNRILMSVMPKISSGRVNPDTGLPEEETTDVTTTVMLDSGQAMVIGGLITENDTDIQTKVPIVGDLWGVGRIFQRRTVVRERNEIVIALIPRIVPYGPEYSGVEGSNTARATTPLLDGPLHPVDRQGFEPQLPDATAHPRTMRLDRLLRAANDLKRPTPRTPEYYFPSNQDPWYYRLDD